VPAGHAVAGQRVAQYFRAGTGEQPFERAIGQRRAHQRTAREQGMAPLTRQEQQAGQQTSQEKLGLEVAQPGHQHHGAVNGFATVLLHQRHHALIEGLQVGPAKKHRRQCDEAEAGDQPGTMTLIAQAAVQAQADQYRQGPGDDAGIQPETFWQGQAHGRTGGPAGQQIGHRPTGTRHQADGDEARQRHIEHPGHHWQHRPQRADEAADQQAGDAVALEVGLGAADPFGVMAQQRQAADVLVEVLADGV